MVKRTCHLKTVKRWQCLVILKIFFVSIWMDWFFKMKVIWVVIKIGMKDKRYIHIRHCDNYIISITLLWKGQLGKIFINHSFRWYKVWSWKKFGSLIVLAPNQKEYFSSVWCCRVVCSLPLIDTREMDGSWQIPDHWGVGQRCHYYAQ